MWWLACAAPRLPGPILDRVEPPFAYNGELAVVAAIGDGFVPAIAIDAANGEADIDRAYTAWLVGPGGDPSAAGTAGESWNELVGVEILDRHTLTATIPPGLSAGLYDLVVENGSGAQASLEGSFTVTDTQAVRIELSTSSTVVGESASIHLALLDSDDQVVPVDLDVLVQAQQTDPAGAPPVELAAGTLLNAVSLASGAVQGRLDQGQADLQFTSFTAGEIALSVDPLAAGSPIAGDDTIAEVRPGGEVNIEILLPEGVSPTFRAGDPIPMTARFVDGSGNPVALISTVLLTTDCSAWAGGVAVNGDTPFVVVPKFATSDLCPEDRVRALYGAVGESAPFTVVGGDPDHFLVDVSATPEIPAIAGSTLIAEVSPVDVNGNETEWTGEITVMDSVGGVVGSPCVDSGLGSSVQTCFVSVVRAGENVVLTAIGEDGLTGTSAPYTVLPADEPASIVLAVTGPAVAGEPLEVVLQPYDVYGNAMIGANLGAEVFAIDDPLAESECTFTGFAADGSVSFDCVLFTAGSTVLAPTLDTGTIRVDGPPVQLDVVNGPLFEVRVEGAATRIAGTAFLTSLTGLDAWGNPYVVQTDPHLDLSDDSGTYTVSGADLGATGTVSVNGAITSAGLTTLRVGQAGIELGASEPFLVVAAGRAEFALSPRAPWAWVDEPLQVQVEVVDAYGNRTSDSLSAVLTSDVTDAEPVQVSIVNGIGESSFVWTDPVNPDLLRGSGEGLVGEIEITVSSRCVADGPSIDLAFGGHAEAVACLDAEDQAVVTADLSASVPGATPIVSYGLGEPSAATVVGVNATVDATLVGAGPHELWALVVDAAGCGEEIRTTGWAGPDDGTPVGPIPLTAAASSLGVFDLTAIDVVGVTDCSRDPAAFQDIVLRATGGELGGVAPTGSGLALVLDAAGESTFTLSTNGGLSEGVVEIHATVPSASAGGFAAIPLVGDDIRPFVIDQTPIGSDLSLIPSATLLFSEPLLESSVVAQNFSVSGPIAVTVTSAVLLPDGKTVDLTFSPAVDGALGVFTVIATSAVRDLSGSKLAGDWGLAAADYRAVFGDVGAAPPPVSCTEFSPVGLSFRPDGDPGLDDDADVFTVDVAATSAPAWWVVVVRDGLDVSVWHGRQVPVAATDTVVWSGRGFDGLIVPSGSYTIEITGDDGLGNRSDGCNVVATVLNADGRPPADRP